MPFKSESQKRKIATLENEGKLPKGTYAKFESETGSRKLPERIKEKKNLTLKEMKEKALNKTR